MDIQSAPGVFDILPENPQQPWSCVHLWQQIEEAIRQVARDFGYQEIRTPVFERTELFQRGVGETSDIVSKEMYTFQDKGQRSLSLRPEGTAPAMRAFIEHQLDQQAPIHKLFYIGPMFRYERAQAGRYRQHHQFGVEAIGSDSPEQDAEVIDLLYTLYQRLGLKNLHLCLNSIGDAACRKTYRTALQDYLRSSLDMLSADSQNRFQTNPLRILDSKDPHDQKILQDAPIILDFLSDSCRQHFEQLQKRLDQLSIPYTVTPHLVRGLDYYTRTVFEFTTDELGAQNSIGGGGRYDGLMKQLGGQNLPAMGFGTGLERVIQTMLKQEVPLRPPEKPTLFIIALGEEAKTRGFALLHELRQERIAAQMDFSGKKLNKVMQYANQLGVKYVAIIGENELRAGKLDLKNMATGETIPVSIDSLTRILQIEQNSELFLASWQEMTRPFKPNEAEFFVHKISDSISKTQKLTNELRSATETMQEIVARLNS